MFFLSYDVETANNKNVGSICAIGWVLLENDEVIDRGYSLINPKCPFSKSNTAIHGITSEDVVSAPSFSDYWNSTLSDLMKKSVVISHSAGFDMSATEQALFDSDIPAPEIIYLDSLHIAKSYLDCNSYKLCDLAALSGYSYNAHHAGEDAAALVHVLKYLRDKAGLEDISSLVIRSGCSVNSTTANNYRPKKTTVLSPSQNFPTHCHEEIAAKDGLFAFLRFCITGDIPGYEREDIERMILEHSGKPTGAVSGKTDYLIVGEFVGYNSSYVSGKVKKALELQEQGGKIKIIRPDEFFSMINPGK